MAKIVSVIPPGAGISAVPGLPNVIPTEFVVRRGYEGEQVIIEYPTPSDPGNVQKIRVVRKLFGFPVDPDDGFIVDESSTQAGKIISDRNVEPLVCYYYKLFTQLTSGEWVTSASVQGEIIPIRTGFHSEKLWMLLPELYKNQDKRADKNGFGKLSLFEGAGITPEVFNLGEDGSVRKGALRRFLKILGPIFDEIKGLIDALDNQLDVDETCLSKLDFLAPLVGLDLNKELTPDKFRNELKDRVPSLKLKGTVAGIQSVLRSVSGITPQVSELCNNVLYSNRVGCHSLAFTPEEEVSVNCPDDMVKRSIGYDGGETFWLWARVFMDITGFGLTNALLNKWCKALDEQTPVCHDTFLYVKSTDKETWPITLQDEEVPVVLGSFLLTSDPDKVTSDPAWVTAYPTP